MRQGNPDVAIVGAGVVGLSCAWFLARAGLRVVILERGCIGRDETVDAHAFDHDADEDWIVTVLDRVGQAFGVQIERRAVVDSWAGLYPSTPDQHPIIDRSDAGMVVVGGFAGLGLMHAPAAGMLARELVVDGAISSIDAAEVSLARFAEPSRSVERTGF